MIEEWQFDYNWRRPHGSLGGKTPVDRITELTEITSLKEDVARSYDKRKERFRHREWRVDKILAEQHRRISEAAASAATPPSDAATKRRSKK